MSGDEVKQSPLSRPWEHSLRPDEVVRRAAAMRFQHYRRQGVLNQSRWEQLTDAQKLPWLLRASEGSNQ